MLTKKIKTPNTQRSFASPWAELDYLCAKVRYWLYRRKNRSHALRFRDRLNGALAAVPTDGKAIIREEGLALVRELDGDIHEAIAHRNREIALMERLHRESQSPQHNDSTRRYMLRDRDETAFEHRRSILQRAAGSR